MTIFGNTLFSSDEANNNRLDARHKMIIERNNDCFPGKRVLDLGSHDGRWAWAALNAGAAYVKGIEGRPQLVDKANFNFRNMKIAESDYDFVSGDVFSHLVEAASKGDRFDTILCLGLFYHIMDHYRFLRLMTSLGANTIIVDTGLVDTDQVIIKLIFEDVDQISNAIPEFPNQRQTVVGYPSRSAFRAMTKSIGWNAKFLEWKADDFSDKRELADYFNVGEGKHRRFTVKIVPDKPGIGRLLQSWRR